MIAPVGRAVPDTPHAVSVSLPTWRSNVGYEEGEEWVVSKMKTGYPRFFIHLIIQELEREILKHYGQDDEKVMLFPSRRTAQRCHAFFFDKIPDLSKSSVRLLHLRPPAQKASQATIVLSSLSCVFFPKEYTSTAKQVWQHSGDGISSRRGQFCLQALKDGLLVPIPDESSHSPQDLYGKGPRRYARNTSQNNIPFATNGQSDMKANGVNGHANDIKDSSQFIEERFGRNLNPILARKAKQAIRRRIAGCLTDDIELDEALAKSETCQQKVRQADPLPGDRLRNVSEDDVYLYPTGMSAIFNAHQLTMKVMQEGTGPRKSICFGFPYIDTLKTLEKWGPGALFYGQGVDADLDDLEERLKRGERYTALFTEFPSNPLLRSPNLSRIRSLADTYDFAVIIDETVGNYINISVLSHADIVVSSLTKIFSGDSNVMGGSMVLNNRGRVYSQLKQALDWHYEDNYWAEDAVFMERNSRDFVSRISRINRTAETMAHLLASSPYVENVYYPSLVPSRPNYDAFKTPHGGYGGLLSVTFHNKLHAPIFFDSLQIEKGPSLGTNFSLACPFVLLAHYGELEWARSLGVDPDLVRISFGLEETQELVTICRDALDAIAKSGI